MMRKTLRSMLPDYVNQTLGPVKRAMVAWWLAYDVSAHEEFQALQHLHNALQERKSISPSIEVWHKIQSGISLSKTSRAPIGSQIAFWQTWIGGMLLVTLSLFLLWNELPPAVVLQWSAQGGNPTMFRVYRSISGETKHFELVDEILPEEPVSSLDTQVYTYRDLLLLPGLRYIYRVEVIDQAGFTTSQTIMSDAVDALPGQVGILFAIICLLYGFGIAIRKQKSLTFQQVV